MTIFDFIFLLTIGVLVVWNIIQEYALTHLTKEIERMKRK